MSRPRRLAVVLFTTAAGIALGAGVAQAAPKGGDCCPMTPSTVGGGHDPSMKSSADIRVPSSPDFREFAVGFPDGVVVFPDRDFVPVG